jgi:vacuolar-type H+-ATPase subunit H
VTPVGPIQQLARISQYDVFKEASNEAKRLRRETELAAGEKIKTIFAENELQAEELLNEPRGEEPMTGEDY